MQDLIMQQLIKAAKDNKLEYCHTYSLSVVILAAIQW